MLKKFKFPWFGISGIFIYPVSLPGLALTMASVAYLVYEFIDIDSRSHSVSDTIRPFIITCAFVYIICFVIALLTRASGKSKEVSK